MAIVNDIFCLTTPKDELESVRLWIRTERQRVGWTQSDLSSRSGVPAATVSRLERTGLASTDAFFRILFALDRLECLQDFVKERRRLASFPLSAADEPMRTDRQRVRHRKGAE